MTTLMVAHGADGWTRGAARAPSGSPGSSSPASSVSPPSASPSPSPSPRVSQSSEDPNKALTDRLQALDAGGATLSVAVLDLSDGRTAQYNVKSGLTYDTASIVKIDILATLLLQAQDDGRALTSGEKSYAVPMVTNSDNAAATALWNIVGGSAGLNAANERLGLTGTTAGTNGHWGLTQTTAADQITLLSQVFGKSSVLTTDSRNYIRDLMSGVSAGQSWGVSAAGDTTGLKNGWLQRSQTALWDITSIGDVTIGDDPCLLAVLSKGNAGKNTGISLVEKAAKATASVMEQGH
ncbi:serine hydrolase [Streptomyces sp. NPDC056653]|uniref:serine hydrolase n=1 Tax=Streptomyces sp. NPDC056653 TaxID=3345894 RepID=UPI0036931CA3